MSEFDFDELDKAVAGAIGTDSTDVTKKEDTSVVTVSETSKTTEDPEISTTKVAPAARRTSGRFMDVVHPSSDMRTRSAPAFVTPSKAQDEQPSLEVSEDQPINEGPKPLESPFLSDAKVEKRPLGGVGPEPSSQAQSEPEPEESKKPEESEETEPQTLLEAPEEELLLEANYPDPIDFAAQSSALDSENEDTGAPFKVEDEATEQTIEQLDELETSVESEDKATAPVAEASNQPTGPTSITQQYTEQEVKSQESGAIFDTENYHQPLTAAPKKHSGVWTVIWILLLVILGAGAGVAFYLFVLPLL